VPYDVAQICLNGHVTNGARNTIPHRNLEYCDKCGAKIIAACPGCSSPLRGAFIHYRYGKQYTDAIRRVPAFCEKCGQSFPWTQSRIEAARNLADGLELDVPERSLLEASIDEIIRDTPKAPAEAVRFKALVERAKPFALEAFKQVLGAVVSEGVKKIIWP
jgi:hypothetical protein